MVMCTVVWTCHDSTRGHNHAQACTINASGQPCTTHVRLSSVCSTGSTSAPTPAPPVALATCASLLASHCPVLHTPLGELYEAPPVQLIKLTIHKAEGLHNLNVEPTTAAGVAGSSPRARLAAAFRTVPSSNSQRSAASNATAGSGPATAGGSGAAAGGGSSGGAAGGTSDAAAAAAAAAAQLREKSSVLLNKTSDWFKKQKASRFGAGAAAVLGEVGRRDPA